MLLYAFFLFPSHDQEVANKKENMILLKKDPQGGVPIVELSKKQEERIQEHLSAGIKFRLDQKYAETG